MIVTYGSLRLGRERLRKAGPRGVPIGISIVRIRRVADICEARASPPSRELLEAVALDSLHGFSHHESRFDQTLEYALLVRIGYPPKKLINRPLTDGFGVYVDSGEARLKVR